MNLRHMFGRRDQYTCNLPAVACRYGDTQCAEWDLCPGCALDELLGIPPRASLRPWYADADEPQSR